ncbi:MAG: transposase, partial [Bacteroidota bacterium]|nr:transposase [Bacteroidota bacterium]
TDGYAAYSIYEEKQGVLPLGCMAHVRRKFENALTTTLETNLKAEKADYEQIRKEQEVKAYPILQQMENWMKQTANTCTSKSPLGKAISYAFSMWTHYFHKSLIQKQTGMVDFISSMPVF